MRILLPILFALLACIPSQAQDSKAARENFAYHVKQLDEFVERFNNTESTLLREYIGKQYPGMPINREMLIKSLFNMRDTTWNKKEVLEFIEAVCDSADPVYLHYKDPNWYAEVQCLVRYKGREEIIYLVLKMQHDVNGGSKWVINNVKEQILQSNNSTKVALPPPRDSLKLLNPISHATDFVGLHRIMQDTPNLSNYVAHDSYCPTLKTLFNEIESGKLEFIQVNTVTYHFLQVDGWAFTVQNHHRNSKNSGWLISSLTRISNTHKSHYMYKLLNIHSDYE